MPRFARYIGVDYSGAETPESSLRGLRTFIAGAELDPVEHLPPPSPRKHWTRRGLAEWLLSELQRDTPTLVGIDHGFSFPLRYFEQHQIPTVWDRFLEDFHAHWPTDQPHCCVDFVLDGSRGRGQERLGNAKWRRLTEQHTRGAKSVFHFHVQGSVAKSTHAGIPWLHVLRRQLGPRVHFWPFDGWNPPAGISVVAEVYPALWNKSVPQTGRDPHQHDAFCTALALRRADHSPLLEQWLQPALKPSEQTIARVEGWILGVERQADEAAGASRRPHTHAKGQF